MVLQLHADTCIDKVEYGHVYDGPLDLLNSCNNQMKIFRMRMYIICEKPIRANHFIVTHTRYSS